MSHPQMFADDERFVVPAYVGPFGWLAIALDIWEPSWDEVLDLLDESFRMTAPLKLVKELDSRAG